MVINVQKNNDATLRTSLILTVNNLFRQEGLIEIFQKILRYP